MTDNNRRQVHQSSFFISTSKWQSWHLWNWSRRYGHYCKATDARLQRDLSLQEFIEAFNMFKNILCGIEDRRVELDSYLQDIIDMTLQHAVKSEECGTIWHVVLLAFVICKKKYFNFYPWTCEIMNRKFVKSYEFQWEVNVVFWSHNEICYSIS